MGTLQMCAYSQCMHDNTYTGICKKCVPTFNIANVCARTLNACTTTRIQAYVSSVFLPLLLQMCVHVLSMHAQQHVYRHM